MTFDYDKYNFLEEKIKDFLKKNPQSSNQMSEEKITIFWDLLNEQRSLIEVIRDTYRK